MTGTAVADSSCLIALEQIELLWILPRLYHRVVVPRGVRDEVRPTIPVIPPWARVTAVEAAPPPPDRIAVFGRGGREVVAAALALRPDVVILDDRDARRWAAELGLPLKGTVAILIDAKASGLLPALIPALDHLRATGFFLSQRLYVAALTAAGKGN